MQVPLYELEAQRVELSRALTAERDTTPRFEELTTALAAVRDQIAERQERLAYVRGQHRRGHTDGDPARETRATMHTSTRSQQQESAVRSVDRLYEADQIGADAGQNLVNVIDADRTGAESRYVEAVSSPEYLRAWNKSLFAAGGAGAALTAAESEALARVGGSMAERAMLVGEGAKGGWAVPAALDPTITLVSDGTLSPLRQLANVTSTSSAEWLGIGSEGVEAEFAKEGEEAGDNAPTLTQPKARPARAQAFVGMSIEIASDWSNINQELAKLFADAKDVLEAEKFLFGTGEDEPSGLLNKVAAGSKVETATKEIFVAGDVYETQQKLPPRFQGRASWISSLTVANDTHRFSSPGGEEAPLFNADRTKLLGKDWFECSDMSVSVAKSGEMIYTYGDFSKFRVIDRVGLSVEPIQHLFGENGRPLGMRGLYCYWRVTSLVEVANAFRVLVVKA